MAIETKVRASNMFPIKSSHPFVEVVLKDDSPASGGNVSDAIPLGKSYGKIKPVSVAASLDAVPGAYADCAASVAIIDNASLKIVYKASAPVTVIATLECEV
jgi:hypothetical protein